MDLGFLYLIIICIYTYIYVDTYIYIQDGGPQRGPIGTPSGGSPPSQKSEAAKSLQAGDGGCTLVSLVGVLRLTAAKRPSAISVDSKKLEYGPGMIYGGFPSFWGFGVGG